MRRPTVAIIGASADRAKFGNKSVRAHSAAGYDVYPVNSKGGTIEGWPAFRSLEEAPGSDLQRISIYLPPRVTLQMLEQIAARPCEEVWFNPGSFDESVRRRAEELGLNAIYGCSIVALGVSPGDFPD